MNSLHLESRSNPGNLDDMALLADKIMEVAISSPSIAAVNTNSELEDLCKEVTKLKSMLQGLQF